MLAETIVMCVAVGTSTIATVIVHVLRNLQPYTYDPVHGTHKVDKYGYRVSLNWSFVAELEHENDMEHVSESAKACRGKCSVAYSTFNKMSSDVERLKWGVITPSELRQEHEALAYTQRKLERIDRDSHVATPSEYREKSIQLRQELIIRKSTAGYYKSGALSKEGE